MPQTTRVSSQLRQRLPMLLVRLGLGSLLLALTASVSLAAEPVFFAGVKNASGAWTAVDTQQIPLRPEQVGYG